MPSNAARLARHAAVRRGRQGRRRRVAGHRQRRQRRRRRVARHRPRRQRRRRRVADHRQRRQRRRLRVALSWRGRQRRWRRVALPNHAARLARHAAVWSGQQRGWRACRRRRVWRRRPWVESAESTICTVQTKAAVGKRDRSDARGVVCVAAVVAKPILGELAVVRAQYRCWVHGGIGGPIGRGRQDGWCGHRGRRGWLEPHELAQVIWSPQEGLDVLNRATNVHIGHAVH